MIKKLHGLAILDLVKGSTIQSKNLGRDITQGYKTLVGGELKAYTEMMNDTRALATKCMVEEAESMGADLQTHNLELNPVVFRIIDFIFFRVTLLKLCFEETVRNLYVGNKFLILHI